MTGSKLDFYYINVPRGKPLNEELNGAAHINGYLKREWTSVEANPVSLSPVIPKALIIDGIRWVITATPTLTNGANMVISRQDSAGGGEIDMFTFDKAFKDELVAISEDVKSIDSKMYGLLKFKPPILVRSSTSGFIKIASSNGDDILTSINDKAIFKLEGWFLDDESDFN